MSTATGAPAAARTAGRGFRTWPARLAAGRAALSPRTAFALGALAWILALAAIAPLVMLYLTNRQTSGWSTWTCTGPAG